MKNLLLEERLFTIDKLLSLPHDFYRHSVPRHCTKSLTHSHLSINNDSSYSEMDITTIDKRMPNIEFFVSGWWKFNVKGKLFF
jgi:hypothetical protein